MGNHGKIKRVIPEKTLLKIITAIQNGKTASEIKQMYPEYIKHSTTVARIKKRYVTDPIADEVIEEVITGKRKQKTRNSVEQKRYDYLSKQVIAYIEKSIIRSILERPKELVNVLGAVDYALNKLMEINETHENRPSQQEILSELKEIKEKFETLNEKKEKTYWLNRLKKTTEHICDEIKRDTLRINAIGEMAKFLELLSKLRIVEEYVTEFHKYMNAIFYGYAALEENIYEVVKARVLEKEAIMEKFFNEYETVEYE